MRSGRVLRVGSSARSSSAARRRSVRFFGLVSVLNPRWQQCDCQTHQHKTFRPLKALLPERSSPELRYLETKWASLTPYGVTTKLLHDLNFAQIRLQIIGNKRRMESSSERMAFIEHDLFDFTLGVDLHLSSDLQGITDSPLDTVFAQAWFGLGQVIARPNDHIMCQLREQDQHLL